MDTNTLSVWQIAISSFITLVAIAAPVITNITGYKKSVFEKKLTINYEATRIAYGRFAESYGIYKGEPSQKNQSIFFSALSNATLFADKKLCENLNALGDTFNLLNGTSNNQEETNRLYRECINSMHSELVKTKNDLINSYYSSNI